MKPWHIEIREHIDRWSRQLGNRGWWPKYVYHFTDVTNAAHIIESGTLYCRTEAIRLGLMNVDNAAPDVIGHTSIERQNLVRLYFRPRTPTQYQNEGIRPLGQRALKAHCPVPVFFCFDAFALLSRDSTRYSDGNIGSARVRIGEDSAFFASIPFNLVFHDGWFDVNNPAIRDPIIFHRNAEVLVPGSLALDNDLVFLTCRSAAERRTLLQLLPEAVRTAWERKIRLDQPGMFERKWSYVEDVVVIEAAISIRFSPSSYMRGPYTVRFIYQEDGSAHTIDLARKFDKLPRALRVPLPDANAGVVTLYLDDALAFRGRVYTNPIPF